MPRKIPVGLIDDLPPGDARIVALSDGREIAVFNVAGTYYAVDNRCPHYGAPLVTGRVADNVVTCPLHRYKFRLDDGACLTYAPLGVRTYVVVVEGAGVYVQV